MIATLGCRTVGVTHTEGGYELLHAYEDALYRLGGRPHWGHVNTLTGALVGSMYPEYERWLDVHQQLNASGVFDSPFSRRVGISTERFRT